MPSIFDDPEKYKVRIANIGECPECGNNLTLGHECSKIYSSSKSRNYSLRSTEWLDFSKQVFNHIENYTVPQYGDKGKDQCSEFSESDFVTQMKRYLNRYGKNVREGQQKLDLVKIAHYAGMLHAKLTNEEKA